MNLRHRPQGDGEAVRRHRSWRHPPARSCRPASPAIEPYCPYTKNPGTKWTAPDLAKAKQLVKESGTAGQKVTIIVEDLTVDRAIGIYLQSVLKSIGYDASVKVISQNIQFTYIQNTNNKVQISLSRMVPGLSGGLRLPERAVRLRDLPSRLGQLAEHRRLLRQGHRRQDERRAGHWASPIDAAANKKWADDRQGGDRPAPAAVLFTPKHVDFMSKRVRQLRLQRPVLLGQHTASWVQVETRALGSPGGLFIGGIRQDDGQPADHD